MLTTQNVCSPRYVHRYVATWSCREHVDESMTEYISAAALRAWNKLPTQLKLLWSTDSFRRDLKSFLFVFVFGIVVKFEEINLKFRNVRNVQDVIKFE